MSKRSFQRRFIIQSRRFYIHRRQQEDAAMLPHKKKLIDIREEYVEMLKKGIIDPVKVTKSALENAVSISATLLTTEAAVADIKEKKPAVSAAGGGADMDY